MDEREETLNHKTRAVFALIILGVLIFSIGGYFLVLKPLIFPVNIEKATKLLEEGKLDEAIGLYQKILASNPDLNTNFIANRDIGRCYFLKKDYDKAIPYYRKAIELRPDIASIANKDLGIIFYRAKSYDLSLEYLTRALDIADNPSAIPIRLDELYFYICKAYYREKQLDKSTEYCKKVTEMSDKASPFYLGYSYYQLGDYDQAELYLNRYLDNNPDGIESSSVKNTLNVIKEKKAGASLPSADTF